jgi:hypothetical protein
MKDKSKKFSKIIDQEFLKVYGKLRKSMIEKGSEIKNIGVKFITKSNRYLVATEDLKNNTEIIKIPFKNLIHIENDSVRQYCLKFLEKKDLYKNQYDCLLFWLANQIKKPSKEFEFYIKTIPKSFKEYSFYWPEKDLKKIRNTIDFSKFSWKDKYEELKKFVNKSDLKNKFSKEEIKYAHIALGSRNFSVRIGKKDYNVLVPFADMFNYNPKTKVVWSKKIKDQNEFFTVKAKKPIKKGEEIFLDYGYKNNVKLLKGYGFTLKDNPFPYNTNKFSIKYKNTNFKDLELKEKYSEPLVKIINKLKKFDKENGKKVKKSERIHYEISLFKILLKRIRSFKNTKIIEEIRKNINESKNNPGILRVLLTEDKLIETNTRFILEIIEILKGRKKENSKVYKENKKYFDEILE